MSDWLATLPTQQLYSIIVPMGMHPYNILLYWISAFSSSLKRSCYLISDPWYFAQLSNVSYDNFKDFHYPFSAARILSTWQKIEDQESDYVILIENVFMLRQLLDNNVELLKFVKQHPNWRFITLFNFNTDATDIHYVQQKLGSEFAIMKTNFRPHHQIDSHQLSKEDLKLWLVSLPEKAILHTATSNLSQLVLNYPSSYVYSTTKAPEGITRWGLNMKMWMYDPEQSLLITDSVQLERAAEIKILIIDREITAEQYLSLLASISVPSIEAKNLEVYFIGDLDRRELHSELSIKQRNFQRLLNSAQYLLISGGRRKINIISLDT